MWLLQNNEKKDLQPETRRYMSNANYLEKFENMLRVVKIGRGELRDRSGLI